MTTNENPNQKASATQCQRILAYLMSGETITSLEAVKQFQTMRLASRIHDIRSSSDELYDDIQKVRVQDKYTGKHFDAYYSEKAISQKHGFLLAKESYARECAYTDTMKRINS